MALRKFQPDYENFGDSEIMGKQLKQLVEDQLLKDLEFYGVRGVVLNFDWSESCIEGHRADYLDGFLENFSGITVFDKKDKLVADGWMEFILDPEFFIAYWEFVTIWNETKIISKKEEVGIPEHVWQKIPTQIQPKYHQLKVKKRSNFI
jgi:hypothetical protein